MVAKLKAKFMPNDY
jgi:hypothetical protein